MARFADTPAQRGLSAANRTNEKAPTAAIRKPAVHDADFSSERIVALPEADDDRRRIGRYGASCAQPRDVDRL
jgi:hypothetical protein